MADRIIRVLLTDDHPLVREGIRSCLAATPHIKVVGEAANGREAVERVRSLDPDVVLMDLNMPGMGGLAAAAVILRRSPRVRVLALTVHGQLEYSVEIMASGMHGHVSKDAAPAELIRAIEAVHCGGTHFTLDATVHYLRRHAATPPCVVAVRSRALTSREEDVLTLVAEGLSNRQIASRLGIGVRTVETHRERLIRKLDIHTVAGLTRYALAHGIGTRVGGGTAAARR